MNDSYTKGGKVEPVNYHFLNMINCIIFSFDRAMQLDLLLTSIIQHDLSKLLNLKVIYTTSDQDFEKGYELLKNKFKDVQWYKEVKSKERFVWPVFHFYWRNYYWWFKYKYNRHIKSNFKPLVISILESTNNQFVMFLTDDSLFIKPIIFDISTFKTEEQDSIAFSYSLRHGKNISGGIYSEQANLINWKLKDDHINPEWSYPFSVDGHIYHQKSLLEILKKIIFHNPNTLEGNIACYANDKNLFQQSFGNKQSCLLGFELNRVQELFPNNNLNVSKKTLNTLFLKGYKLNLDYTLHYPHPFRPELNEVIAKKRNHIVKIYEQH